MHNDSYTCLGALVALAAFGCLGALVVLGVFVALGAFGALLSVAAFGCLDDLDVLGVLGALGALVAFNPRIVPAASVTISDATKVASRVMMEAKDVMNFMMVFRRK
jgi:hypothetical protein